MKNKLKKKVEHTECEFGRWLYSDETQNTFGCYDEFKELLNLHKIIHSTTNELLKCTDTKTCISNPDLIKENIILIEETSAKMNSTMNSLFDKIVQTPCNS